jgi:hypothetical protein
LGGNIQYTYIVGKYKIYYPSPTKLRRNIVTLPSVRPSHPCEHSRFNILQWILTILGTYLVRTKYVPSVVKIHWRMLILVFTRMLHGKIFTQWPWPLTLKSIINILQWILTKLGTYIVLMSLQPYWFSSSKVKGSNFYHITSLWTLESRSFNGFWPNLAHT